MDNALAVISASTDNIEIMHGVLAERAHAHGVAIGDLTPELWLKDFYASRKGPGKPAKQTEKKMTTCTRVG
jgi:type IV secretion system protein VirB4